MMYGIDVSNWQKGIDPTKLGGVEFCICKATEGLTYVSPDCDRVVQLCRKRGMPWGFYHFARRNNAVKEADWFVANCENYFGEGIPVLDWEDDQSVAWVNKFVRRIHERTSVWPWVYANPWRFNQGGVEPNCGRWIAQYPQKITSFEEGLPEHEKTDGLVCAWQFSSSVRLPEWSGNLDADVFYGNVSAWQRYAQGERSQKPTPGASKTITVEDERYRVDITPK